jgi:hypothetical protein
MPYSEIIAVCSENHIRHKNSLCTQNVAFFKAKPDSAYGNHKALKG